MTMVNPLRAIDAAGDGDREPVARAQAGEAQALDVVKKSGVDARGRGLLMAMSGAVASS